MKINNHNEISTEFGTARINNKGYYYIVSRKEGNKSFQLMYNSKAVSIGYFHSFDTVECIYDLIEESL